MRRGGVSFIPKEAKRRGLDHLQVSKQEREHTSLREGRPTRVWEREKRNGEVEGVDRLRNHLEGAH
jgi:hypothetical protein